MIIDWAPGHLPTLDELREHYGEAVQPQVDYAVFCDWSDTIRVELDDNLCLFIDRSAHACEYGWWCLILYDDPLKRLDAHGLEGHP